MGSVAENSDMRVLAQMQWLALFAAEKKPVSSLLVMPSSVLPVTDFSCLPYAVPQNLRKHGSFFPRRMAAID